MLIGVWLLMPWISRGLHPGTALPRLALLATLVLAVITLGASLTMSVHDINGTLPVAASSKPMRRHSPILRCNPTADWQAYGRTWFGDRFSPVARSPRTTSRT